MIEIKNLSKSIKGNLVLDNISCRLDAGQVYGIYGRNGSGKTMIMRNRLRFLITIAILNRGRSQRTGSFRR